jgi:hypothetical protein
MNPETLAVSQTAAQTPAEDILANTRNPEIKTDEPSPEQKVNDSLKEYPFIRMANGVFHVDHAELRAYLKPVILKTGNLVKRGTILANLSGGAANLDPQSQGLNSCIATAQVGFEGTLKLDLLNVEDTDLLMGLYVAVVAYNNFFRKTPLGFTL